MIKHSISYEDLTGGLNNVDTINRINSSTRRTESPDIMNIEYFELGGIKSMDGNTQIGDTQSSKIVGGCEYRKGNDLYLIIYDYHLLSTFIILSLFIFHVNN